MLQWNIDQPLERLLPHNQYDGNVRVFNIAQVDGDIQAYTGIHQKPSGCFMCLLVPPWFCEKDMNHEHYLFYVRQI